MSLNGFLPYYGSFTLVIIIILMLLKNLIKKYYNTFRVIKRIKFYFLMFIRYILCLLDIYI